MDPASIIARLLVWAIAAPVHEFSHAFAAYRLGDDTAARQGRLTLNPAAHLDVLGTLLIAFAGFGWARPVPYNPYALRYGPRMGGLIVAIAGPISNLLLATLFAIPVRLGLIELDFSSGGLIPTLGRFWLEAIYLNLLLLLFNLLPVAPLDGFKVMMGVLPEDLAYRFARTEQFGPIILLALIFLGRIGTFNLLDVLIGGPLQVLFLALVGR